MLVIRSNPPAELEEATLSPDSRTEDTGHGELDLAYAPCRRKGATSNPPYGLVVSSDDEIRRQLAESLGECGLASMFSSTVEESRIAVAERQVFVVVCNEWLPDGSYLDIVKLTARSCTRIPLIVISRIGDWPEYLRAICAGAFDYVAYPPIRGEFRRVIRNALLGGEPQRHLEGV
jgi:DNA-binding NtrC family response regulator